MLPSDHGQKYPAPRARLPAPNGEDLRRPGREEGRQEHDGSGAIGASEEGSQGGSEETDGEASRAKESGQTGEEEGRKRESEPDV